MAESGHEIPRQRNPTGQPCGVHSAGRKWPPQRPLRGPQPWLKRVLHPVTAPFTDILGGPLFDDCEHRRVDCGAVEVEFFQPQSYFGHGTDPDAVDPSDDRTFDEVAGESRAGHRKVNIDVTNWNYCRPRIDTTRYLPLPQEPYVIITAYWQLERIKHDIQLRVGDTASLEAYLRSDYEDFMESEGGINWQIRKDENEVYPPEERERMRETIEYQISGQLLSKPEIFEAMRFNGVEWLRYAWEPCHVDAVNYTTVLTPRTLMTFCLSVTRMYGNRKTDAKWRQALEEDSALLMGGVKLHYKALPGKSADLSD